MTLNPKGVITRINLTGTTIMGFERTRVLETDFNQYIEPEDEQIYFAAVERAGNTGKKESAEFRLKRRNAPSLWTRADIKADRDKAGTVKQWRMALADISKYKEAQRALRESEELHRITIEHITDPVFITDSDGRFTFICPNIPHILGYSVEELHAMDNVSACVGAGRKLFDLDELNRRGKISNIEAVIVNKNGVKRDYLINVKRVSIKGGTILYVCRDITERKKQQEKNKKLEAQLRQFQKMESIGTLAGGVAHEFNNILGIILGNTELAIDGTPEWSPVTENLKNIRNTIMRAGEVVRQLLTFSRKDNSKKSFLNLGFVVEETLKLIRSSMPANIGIRQRIPKEPLCIHGDATRIHQLMINLCGNAMDAMSENGGTLSVEITPEVFDAETAGDYGLSSPGPHAKLVIKDTGTGMDTQTLKQVFEPFYTTKEVGKGTGMGLAVVDGIVKDLGGSISVESEPGKETLFTIWLPVIHGRATPEITEKIDIPTGTESILFVDDEPTLAQLGKALLARLGYRVTAATDPAAALEMVRTDPKGFDLVVTDMAMPKMAGDQLAEKLLEIRPDLPIILSTGYSEKISKITPSEIGICSILMKPADSIGLAVAVRKALDERERAYRL